MRREISVPGDKMTKGLRGHSGILIVTVFLATTAIGAPSSAVALGSKPSRVESFPYLGASPGVSTPLGFVAAQNACDEGVPGACIAIPTRKRDRYVSLEVKDQSGLPLFLIVDYGPTSGGTFWMGCQRIDERIPVGAGITVFVYLLNGSCYPRSQVGIATMGEVEATFYR